MLLTPPSTAPQLAPARLATSELLVLALAMLAPFLLYFATARSIVAIWDSSETFAHGYIILPISAWLIWRRRANFLVYPPTPYWPALLLLALAGAGWLLARLGEVQVVAQYAFVAMLPIIALALLGRRLAGSLAFPLLFLLFAVPFGEVFIEPLISFTADFTVWALQMVGIPVLRNGTRFEIPSGSWSVVTACSGVRYLISSVTIGCLYAYLTYRSTTRRVLCIAMSIVVPIIANGLRAFMIVMIGHLSSMTLATGVDHLIYGWLFFGLVMFIMFWIGNSWREDEQFLVAPAPDQAGSALASHSRRAMLPAVAATLAVAALWPALAHLYDKLNTNPAAVTLQLALSTPAAPPFAVWQPTFMPADATFTAITRSDAASAPVATHVLFYRNQSNQKSLISSANTVVGEKDDFHVLANGAASEQLGGVALPLREIRLGSDRSGNMLVWQWYWIDGARTASASRGKLLQARAKLMLHGDDGAVVMMAAPYTDNIEQARQALRAHLQREGAAIDAAIVAAHSR